MQETWDDRGAFARVLRRRGAAMNSRIKKSIFQFAVCTAVVAFVVLCVYLYYSYESQSSENERRALAEARVLAAEDAEADQSSVLADLPQEILTKLVLPLGDFTKADVEEMLAEAAE